MKKTFTGEFGVIDLNKLADHKLLFGFFAEQLAYPDKHTFQEGAFAKGVFPPSIEEEIDVYWQQMQQFSLEDIQENYVQLFDFQQRSTLYMTYAKFEDAKERGQMLAKLKSMYEMFGLEITNNELADYLPLICEFIYAADWSTHEHAEPSFQTLLAVMEDGTYGLLKALEKLQSPYYYLVKGLRELFKLCLAEEVKA